MLCKNFKKVLWYINIILVLTFKNNIYIKFKFLEFSSGRLEIYLVFFLLFLIKLK
jgi:hypothetical protein